MHKCKVVMATRRFK